ncbi:hypothetical protein EsH8_IX_000935 [Colletotrichum jinshuiense]
MMDVAVIEMVEVIEVVKEEFEAALEEATSVDVVDVAFLEMDEVIEVLKVVEIEADDVAFLEIDEVIEVLKGVEVEADDVLFADEVGDVLFADEAELEETPGSPPTGANCLLGKIVHAVASAARRASARVVLAEKCILLERGFQNHWCIW